MAFQGKKPAAIGVKAPYPGFLEPALARSIEKVPSGKRWVHEIKFDGYRVQVHQRDAAAKVFTRRGNDWTNRFRKIAADSWHVNAASAIIDGEVVAPSADGTTDFSVLQNELKGRSTKIMMVTLDLLYLNGYDLRSRPLFERKALVKKIVADTDVQLSASFELDGREIGVIFHRSSATGTLFSSATATGSKPTFSPDFSKPAPTRQTWNTPWSMPPSSRSIATDRAQKGSKSQAIGRSKGGMTTKFWR